MSIIGITGYAQHGKDTLANELVQNHGYIRIGFADALKSMAYVLDPLVEVHQAPRSEVLSLRQVVDRDGWEAAKQNPEVRRLLQVLGTECVRDFIGDDSWVKALEKAWMELDCPDIVIPDVRFHNEANWVVRNGGRVVRVERLDFDNGLGDQHPSERFVSELPVDMTLSLASGAMEEFAPAASYIVSTMKMGRLRGPQMPTRPELEDLFR